MKIPRGGALARRARASLRVVAAAALLSLAGVADTHAETAALLVGQVGPFSVLPTPDASQVRDGARAYLDQVNRAGGVHGRRLEYFTLDDAFDPARFLVMFREALDRRPIAILLPIGSAAVGGLLRSGMLDHADTVVIGAIPGAEVFRRPGSPKLFHVSSGDKAQLDRILLQCQAQGLMRVHVLAQDLAVGHDGLAALLASSGAMGGFTLTSVTLHADPAALRTAAEAAARRAPDSIVIVGTPVFMADTLAALRAAGAHEAVFALSYLPVPLAVARAGAGGARGLGIPQAFPNPNGHDLPLQREFHAAMLREFPSISEYTAFHLEGYVSARLLVEGLRRIDGTPTPTALAQALHSMGEIDLGGFRENFSHGNVGSLWTDIGVISADGKLLY